MLTITKFSKLCGIPMGNLTGRSRKMDLCDARHLCWKLLHESGLRYSSIGRLFGRDHATVASGINRVNSLLSLKDERVIKLYNQTEKLFKEMSKLKHSIEIHPGDSASYQQKETFAGGIYTCPVCNGRGAFVYDIGHKESERHTCDYCRGEGRMRAVVTVKWEPAIGHNHDTGELI